MSLRLLPGPLSGTVTAPPSKSMAQRLLILGALGLEPVSLTTAALPGDAAVVIRCLTALGADIRRQGGSLRVRPLSRPPEGCCLLDCGESGAALRFLLPVAGALGADCRFVLGGRLPERPLAPLLRELERHGMEISREGRSLRCSGRLRPGDYTLPGDISSQFVSGLLLALPRLPGESRLKVTGSVQSAAYIEMTEQALSLARCTARREGEIWRVPGGELSRLPESCAVEGDWSAAAFWLCTGALGGRGVSVLGLEPDSRQGDRHILRLLARMGAETVAGGGAFTVRPGALRGIELDAEQIPDLVPPLCAAAAAAEGETRIGGGARLRAKESDRLKSCSAMLRALGAEAEELPDGLLIRGGGLRGGPVCAQGDHRVAMAAATAACACRELVTIDDESCVAKSYPGFWADRAQLGGRAL